MEDLKSKIIKAHEATDLLKSLNLPISQEQKDLICELEKEYINDDIIPDVQEIIEGSVFAQLGKFSLKIEYNPETGVDVILNETNDDSISRGEPGEKRSFDTTKYSFDGGVHFFNKRRFVYEVVKNYIQSHPTVSLIELEERFPSKIHGKTNGVVRDWKEVQKRMETMPDLRKRFFCEPDEIITLFDGTQITINNQWGDKFYNFLAVAKELHDVIDDNFED